MKKILLCSLMKAWKLPKRFFSKWLFNSFVSESIMFQLAAAILQQFQQGQALGMFPSATPFPFVRAQSSPPSNSNIPQLIENGQHSMTMQKTTISNSNDIYLDQKIPPPPAAPSNVRRRSLPQNIPENEQGQRPRKTSQTVQFLCFM